MPLAQQIIKTYQKHSNPENAGPMKKYMKDNFEYFGIKSPVRKEISKTFLAKYKELFKDEAFELVEELWNEPQRELQYFAMDFLQKYTKQFEKEDIQFIRFITENKAWWDSVDFIAKNITGPYFLKFPEQLDPVLNDWKDSGHLWLQRSCIIYQLGYKKITDTTRLAYFCNYFKHEKEFFLRKAIGWSLREYAKVDPEWVKAFVEDAELEGLSRREALKNL